MKYPIVEGTITTYLKPPKRPKKRGIIIPVYFSMGTNEPATPTKNRLRFMTNLFSPSEQKHLLHKPPASTLALFLFFIWEEEGIDFNIFQPSSVWPSVPKELRGCRATVSTTNPPRCPMPHSKPGIFLRRPAAQTDAFKVL